MKYVHVNNGKPYRCRSELRRQPRQIKKYVRRVRIRTRLTELKLWRHA